MKKKLNFHNQSLVNRLGKPTLPNGFILNAVQDLDLVVNLSLSHKRVLKYTHKSFLTLKQVCKKWYRTLIKNYNKLFK
jgi:hypothetical protein